MWAVRSRSNKSADTLDSRPCESVSSVRRIPAEFTPPTWVVRDGAADPGVPPLCSRTAPVVSTLIICALVPSVPPTRTGFSAPTAAPTVTGPFAMAICVPPVSVASRATPPVVPMLLVTVPSTVTLPPASETGTGLALSTAALDTRRSARGCPLQLHPCRRQLRR